MSHDTVFSPPKASGGVHEQIESFLQTVMRGLMRPHDQEAAAEQAGKQGRPVVLPSVILWMAVLVAVLRGLKSQRAIWRLVAAGGWWKQPSYDIGDQAVYKRLEQEGWKPLAQVFERVSQLIAHWLQPALQAYHKRHAPLASFAKEVVALDEMCLDQVSRRLPIFRHLKKGDTQLLPGKLVALFDVRLQQWRAIEYIEYAKENGMKQAYRMLAKVKAGTTLVLADLGYFSFRWFDELTDLGYSWISRVKVNTSVVVLHTYYQAGETFDRLVWLGAWNIKGKYVVRQVQFLKAGRTEAVLHQCLQSDRLTNGRDCPTVCSSVGYRISLLDVETRTGITSDLEQQIGGGFSTSVGLPHHCSSDAGPAHGSRFAC